MIIERVVVQRAPPQCSFISNWPFCLDSAKKLYGLYSSFDDEFETWCRRPVLYDVISPGVEYLIGTVTGSCTSGRPPIPTIGAGLLSGLKLLQHSPM